MPGATTLDSAKHSVVRVERQSPTSSDLAGVHKETGQDTEIGRQGRKGSWVQDIPMDEPMIASHENHTLGRPPDWKNGMIMGLEGPNDNELEGMDMMDASLPREGEIA